MNASEIKDFTPGATFENSIKTAQTFRPIQFERISNIKNSVNPKLLDIERLLLYCLTEKITK